MDVLLKGAKHENLMNGYSLLWHHLTDGLYWNGILAVRNIASLLQIAKTELEAEGLILLILLTVYCHFRSARKHLKMLLFLAYLSSN